MKLYSFINKEHIGQILIFEVKNK